VFRLCLDTFAHASVHVVPELKQEQIPEEERPNYQKQITGAMQMLKSFDHILTLEFAMRPEKQNNSDVINLYKVVRTWLAASVIALLTLRCRLVCFGGL
jgi:hypothetical protein